MSDGLLHQAQQHMISSSLHRESTLPGEPQIYTDNHMMGQSPGLPTNNTRLKVQLFISCRDLVNVDYVGKTDSLVALYTKHD